MTVQTQESIYNEDNIEILSRMIVEGFDQETLIQFALDNFKQAYQADEKFFMKDWNSFIKYNL